MTFCDLKVLSHQWYNTSMAQRKKQFRKIVIVVDMSAGASARDVLSGIFKFVNTGYPWSLRLIQLPGESLKQSIPGSIASEADGMIVTCEPDRESLAAIAETDVPTVFVDVRHPQFERKAGRVAFVRNDNEGIGRAGAKYLANLGSFNSFGFVPDIENRTWSVLREQTFRNELEGRGFAVRTFGEGSPCLAEDRTRLIAWLKDLPKPAAVMAAFDFRATQIVDACSEAGIRVPGQVALIGVDNDELLCQSANPFLSSIKPDHVHEGFLAAAELHRLFRSRARACRRESFCRIRGVVERESTKATPPAAILIRRALAFIAANATTNLRVDEIASELGVSRRLLERRFRALRGESLKERILQERLAVVKRLLKTTSRSCTKIAAECGFPNANYLPHLFRRETGQTMSNFRSNAD